jgi:RHS repeat-associated protein
MNNRTAHNSQNLQGTFWSSESYPTCYRYGFNGMEKDDEVKGSGNSLDFGSRIYDARTGRWLSVDPVTHVKIKGDIPFYYVK